MMKYNSQNSSKKKIKPNKQTNKTKPITPLIFGPCGLPYDPTDRCAARGGFELESPGVGYIQA